MPLYKVWFEFPLYSLVTPFKTHRPWKNKFLFLNPMTSVPIQPGQLNGGPFIQTIKTSNNILHPKKPDSIIIFNNVKSFKSIHSTETINLPQGHEDYPKLS